MKIQFRILMVFFTITLFAASHANTPLPENAQVAVNQARASMELVLDTYTVHYPDQPYWREVYEEAKQAINLAVGAAEPIGVLAEAYSQSNWHGPAFQTWLDFVSAGGEFTAAQLALFTESAEQNAFAAYQRGELAVAADFYRAVAKQNPADANAFRWLGRIASEMNNPEEAVAAWEVVVDLTPGDDGARYFLDLSRAQAKWGTAAADYFFDGVRLYEANDLNQARLAFASATSQNSSYVDAWAWLGRVNFEQEKYADAARAYQKAADLDPNNSTYSYFLREANSRQ